MWCKHCQQDVPGIVCADSGQYRCPRCAEGIYAPSNVVWMDRTGVDMADGQPAAVDSADDQPPRLYDDWEFDEQLRHIGRVLEVEENKPKPPPATSPRKSLRIDAAHPGAAGRHPAAADRKASGRCAGCGPTPVAMALLIWTVLSLGLMTFVCGGVLLGWSMVMGRQDLWTLGLPITLGGQVALLVGLILQLDRLWHESRSTAAKVERFDAELDHLTSTAAMVDAAHDSPSGAFYAHLAGGAGPQLLLADLKGQLDLLATRLQSQR